jgi:hypothetical protein
MQSDATDKTINRYLTLIKRAIRYEKLAKYRLHS